MMATPKSQRIGIWIIAVVMLVGTLGSFAVMVLGSQNDQNDQAEQQKLMEQYQKEMEKQKKEAADLSAKYYPTFEPYKKSPAAFDPTTVGEAVVTNDLKVGDGAAIEDGVNYKAYYIGWNPDGKTSEGLSSFDEANGLKIPLDTSQIQGLVEGWKQGVKGMKVGGIRELTIPSKLAYGEAGQGEDIPPNTPLKFIVYIIETV